LRIEFRASKTKGRVTLSWKMVAGQKAFFIAFAGPLAHDSCGSFLVLAERRRLDAERTQIHLSLTAMMYLIIDGVLNRHQPGAKRHSRSWVLQSVARRRSMFGCVLKQALMF
jgi:hypothetical protein